MKKDRKYTKGYRTYQIILLITIVIAYFVYILTGLATNNFTIAGVVTANMVHLIVLLLILTQIHTLLDVYKKLNKWVDLGFSVLLAVFSVILAFQFYHSALHIAFPIVLGIIALSHLFNAVHLISSKANKNE
ncbi:steroid 5-alpha reductase family enzyme [Evansella vedderi]|uniref:Steroid 5-alpha reductase family enzyme n=1 Tax=Evansella vedderi TaxID=38282 RepID=A0ABU0A2P6_9BACI|nr:hypothetical protein [Evansella vedderi]MDQ0257525.1 steroid 5-alpha reductase family enzyme [Evansella vedderi]